MEVWPFLSCSSNNNKNVSVNTYFCCFIGAYKFNLCVYIYKFLLGNLYYY